MAGLCSLRLEVATQPVEKRSAGLNIFFLYFLRSLATACRGGGASSLQPKPAFFLLFSSPAVLYAPQWEYKKYNFAPPLHGVFPAGPTGREIACLPQNSGACSFEEV